MSKKGFGDRCMLFFNDASAECPGKDWRALHGLNGCTSDHSLELEVWKMPCDSSINYEALQGRLRKIED